MGRKGGKGEENGNGNWGGGGEEERKWGIGNREGWGG